MTDPRDDDDDALSWGDERDATYVEDPAANVRPKKETRAERARRKGYGERIDSDFPDTDLTDSAEDDPETDAATTHARSGSVAAARAAQAEDEEDLPPVASSALLLTTGILIGFYALYTAGWFIVMNRAIDVVSAATPLDAVMYAVRHWLTILAPALWFVTAFSLTRDRRSVVRLLWLLAGAAVLVPWPFILGS